MKVLKVSVLLAGIAMMSVSANAQEDCATAVAAPGPVDPCADTTPTGPLGPCSASGGASDMWMTFTATSTSTRLRTDIDSGGTDSAFVVYTGDCGNLVQVGCSADECFTGACTGPGCALDIVLGCDGNAAGPWMGNICLDTVIDEVYTVQMGTYGNAEGEEFCAYGPFFYNLTVQDGIGACGDGVIACDGSEECETDAHCTNGQSCVGCSCEVTICPEGCADAVDVGAPGNETYIDPCCAADGAALDGACIGGSGIKSAWMKFTAGEAASRVRTNLNSPGTDSNYLIFSGTCGDLTQIGCSEDEGGNPWLGDINVLTEIGETYYIQIGSYSDSCGPFAITVSGIPGATCGDGIRSALVGEACDPGDGGAVDDVNCPGLCGTGDASGPCQCPTPVCGNGVREGAEQCDLGEGNGADDCILPDCECTGLCKIATDIVPAVSEWGLVVMVLIGLAAGTVMFGRKRVIA